MLVLELPDYVKDCIDFGKLSDDQKILLSDNNILKIMAQDQNMKVIDMKNYLIQNNLFKTDELPITSDNLIFSSTSGDHIELEDTKSLNK